jgi:hypothetical protein
VSDFELTGHENTSFRQPVKVSRIMYRGMYVFLSLAHSRQPQTQTHGHANACQHPSRREGSCHRQSETNCDSSTVTRCVPHTRHASSTTAAHHSHKLNTPPPLNVPNKRITSRNSVILKFVCQFLQTEFSTWTWLQGARVPAQWHSSPPPTTTSGSCNCTPPRRKREGHDLLSQPLNAAFCRRIALKNIH